MNLQKQSHQHIVLRSVIISKYSKSFSSKVILPKPEFKKMPTEI